MGIMAEVNVESESKIKYPSISLEVLKSKILPPKKGRHKIYPSGQLREATQIVSALKRLVRVNFDNNQAVEGEREDFFSEVDDEFTLGPRVVKAIYESQSPEDLYGKVKELSGVSQDDKRLQIGEKSFPKLKGAIGLYTREWWRANKKR